MQRYEAFYQVGKYPNTRMFGVNGDGGLLSVAAIPKKYRQATVESLPFEKDNPKALAIVQKYCGNIVENIDNGMGLYLFGVPSQDNPKGTGTGKTTAATAIIHEYLRQRIILELKQERPIHEAPAYFMKMAKFQNVFNSQFRGSPETQAYNSDKYQSVKQRMMKTDLLVLDDIGLRGLTESLQNEVYEIIDERDTNERTTVFTSNVPIDELNMSEQLLSRIEGMTFAIPFKGKDNRKKFL